MEIRGHAARIPAGLGMLVYLCGVSATVRAQAAGVSARERIQIVRRCKAATAMVLWRRGSSPTRMTRHHATAFCINPAGWFLTCRHVLPSGKKPKDVSLVFRVGDDDEATVAAKVIREDKALDLALLKADKVPGGVEAIEIGELSGKTKGMQMWICGYPADRSGSNVSVPRPSLTVSPARVSLVPGPGAKPQQISVAPQIRSNFQGAAVVDQTGKVVAMALHGVNGNKFFHSLPAGVVRGFVDRPEVKMVPPVVPHERRHDRLPFRAEVISAISPTRPLAVKLELYGGGDDRRTYMLKRKSATTFEGLAPPLEGGGKGQIPMVLDFPDSTIRGKVKDLPFTVGGAALRLAEVASIELGARSKVTTPDGKVLEGKLVGLEKVDAVIGGVSVPLDLAGAVRLLIGRVGDLEAVGYQLSVLAGERVVETLRGTIRIELPKGAVPSWHNALTELNVRKNAVKGRWSVEAGSLVCEPSEQACLALSMGLAGSYRLRARIRTKGPRSTNADSPPRRAVLILPVGGSSVAMLLDLDGVGVSGLMVVDSTSRNPGPVGAKLGKLKGPGNELDVLVRVEKDRAQILLRLDGWQRLSWEGLWSSLRAGVWDLPLTERLGLGTEHAGVAFSDVRVRPLPGGQILTPGKPVALGEYEIKPFATGLERPRVVAVSPGAGFGQKGDLYVTGSDGRKIYRIDSQGRQHDFTHAGGSRVTHLGFGPAGGILEPGLYSVSKEMPLRYDASGRRSAVTRLSSSVLFAVAPDSIHGEPLLTVSKGGDMIKAWAEDRSSRVLSRGNSRSQARGMAVAPEGDFGGSLYVSMFYGSPRGNPVSRIRRINFDGGGGTHSVSPRFGILGAMSFDHGGRLGGGLFVCDDLRNAVFRVTAKGQATVIARGFRFNSEPSADISNRAGLAVGADGGLYVCDRGNGTVWRITKSGR